MYKSASRASYKFFFYEQEKRIETGKFKRLIHRVTDSDKERAREGERERERKRESMREIEKEKEREKEREKE